MKRILFGDKDFFAIQLEVFTEQEVQASEKACEFWGREYNHGFLNIYLEGEKFGEDSYFYPFQPTITCAIENPMSSKGYPELMVCPAEDVFEGFDYAYDKQPDIEDQDCPFDGANKDEVKEFIESDCVLKQYMPDFLYEYMVSSELSNSNILIGSFAFQRLETILLRTDGNVRFLVRDDDDHRVGSVIIPEGVYRKLWRDAEGLIYSNEGQTTIK